MKNLITSFGIFLSLSAFAQNADFNNYKPLQSSGDLPKTFQMTYEDRIQEDDGDDFDLDKKLKENFLSEKAISIDGLMHSGLVIYGDPITKHIKEVAKKLFVDDPEIYDKLSFFLFRSNEANAFVTPGGEVFVTIGLISQLTSDYELAYVLSHEISHYVEDHNVESFKKVEEFKKNVKGNDFDEQIKALKSYSKDHELEADRLGIERYVKAGLPIDKLGNVFDILTYSYLPIDDVVFESSFLTGENAFIPENILPEKVNDIYFDEDYDDTYHSHPNILKRKTQFEDELSAKYKDFRTDREIKFEDGPFNEIRRIARYERVYNWLFYSDFSNALYEIFLLEKKYGENYSFDLMKAMAWTNISVYAAQGYKSDLYGDLEEIQGESYAVHYALKELSKDQVVTLAVRNLVDLCKKYPNDQDFKEFQTVTIKQLARRFDHLDEFAIEKADLVSSTDEEAEGSDQRIMEEDSEEFLALNKYEKIKQKKINEKLRKSEGTVSSDSTDFELYLLSDVVGEPYFISEFKKQEEQVELEEEDEVVLADVEKLVFVEPLATVVKRKYSIERNEEVRETYGNVVLRSANSLGYESELLSKYNMEELGTEGYNRKAMFLRFFYMYSNESVKDLITPDFKALDAYTKDSENTNLIFTYVDYDKKRKEDLLIFVFAFD